MQILMDIDGTIVHQDDVQLAHLLWQALGLPPDECPRTARMAEVLTLPQVSAARTSMGEKRFRVILSMLQQSESAIMSRLVMPGAQKALQQLALLGQIHYCTARKASYSGKNAATTQAIDEMNVRMQRATHHWLAQHGFPYPDQVIFCSGAGGKLEAIATCIHESGDVLFVENEVDAIITAFADLAQEMQAQIAEHAAVLAFGQTRCPSSNLRCLALPTWNRLDAVLSAHIDVGKDQLSDPVQFTREQAANQLACSLVNCTGSFPTGSMLPSD